MIELCESLNVYVGDSGRTYHRVTSILRDVYPNEYEGIDGNVLENAAARGRETELLCVELLTKGYVDSECREDVVPRLEAFDRWRKKHSVEYIDHQLTVFSDEQQVAGTIDFFLVVDGLLTIPDLKCTASKMKTWPIQLGGYASMKRTDQIGNLQLNPDLNKHGFRWYVYDLEQAIGWWKSVHAFWKTSREIGVYS